MTTPTFAGAPPPLRATPLPASVRWRARLWRSRFVLAAVCIAVAVSTALHALDPAAPASTPALVTTHAVEAGAVLSDGDVRVVQLPVGLAPAGVATAAADVSGTATAVPLGVGSPLVPGVLAPRDVHGPAGTVVASVRFADPAVAGLLASGMRVDVVAASAEGGGGRTVARRALVLPTPGGKGGATTGSAGGIGSLGGRSADSEAPPVLLAVEPDEATALAGASASALLSAVVVP